MFQNLRIGRFFFTGAVGVATVLGATMARGEGAAAPHAKKDNLACLATYEGAQERERSGHLVEASRMFSTCAGETCGKSLRQECAAKSTQLNARLPSIVLSATDIAGKPLHDVQVTVDGKPFVSRLDGRAQPIDPGTHEVSFSANGQMLASKRIAISKGEHNRAISVSQTPEGSTEPKASVSER